MKSDHAVSVHIAKRWHHDKRADRVAVVLDALNTYRHRDGKHSGFANFIERRVTRIREAEAKRDGISAGKVFRRFDFGPSKRGIER